MSDLIHICQSFLPRTGNYTLLCSHVSQSRKRSNVKGSWKFPEFPGLFISGPFSSWLCPLSAFLCPHQDGPGKKPNSLQTPLGMHSYLSISERCGFYYTSYRAGKREISIAHPQNILWPCLRSLSLPGCPPARSVLGPPHSSHSLCGSCLLLQNLTTPHPKFPGHLTGLLLPHLHKQAQQNAWGTGSLPSFHS